MKKILLSITLVLAVLICLASCNKEETPQIDNSTAPNTQQTTPNSQETTPKTEVTTPKTEETTPDSQETTGGGNEEIPKTVWETLQELSQKQYSQVNLYIQTVTGDIEFAVRQIYRAERSGEYRQFKNASAHTEAVLVEKRTENVKILCPFSVGR